MYCCFQKRSRFVLGNLIKSLYPLTVDDAGQSCQIQERILKSNKLFCESIVLSILPPELILEVLEHVSLLSRAAFARTCKTAAAICLFPDRLSLDQTGHTLESRRYLLGSEIVLKRHPYNYYSRTMTNDLSTPNEIKEHYKCVHCVSSMFLPAPYAWTEVEEYFIAKDWLLPKGAVCVALDQIMWQSRLKEGMEKNRMDLTWQSYATCCNGFEIVTCNGQPLLIPAHFTDLCYHAVEICAMKTGRRKVAPRSGKDDRKQRQIDRLSFAQLLETGSCNRNWRQSNLWQKLKACRRSIGFWEKATE